MRKQVEQLQDENAKLKARLEAIEQAAQPMQEALSRLHEHSWVKPLYIEVRNPYYLLPDVEDNHKLWVYSPLLLGEMPGADTLAVEHLQTLCSAIKET